MSNWRNDPITDKQKTCIQEINEFSEIPLPVFTGTTKGEAYDYINKYNSVAHESMWGIENGY